MESRLVEQGRGEDRQGVEPPSGLIEVLGDEVGRERGFKVLAPTEGVVALRVWHGPRLEPAVEDFGHAPQRAVPRRCWDLEVVDEVLVQVVHGASGELAQLLAAADAHGFARLLIVPDRQWRSPVAVAADGPVRC